MESRIGFPFRPCVSEDYQWTKVQHSSSLSYSERSFLKTITRDLGDGCQHQSRVYSSADLLSEANLEWCGKGAGLADRKK